MRGHVLVFSRKELIWRKIWRNNRKLCCRARLNTLMVAKPEKGRQVEAMLCQETQPSPRCLCLSRIPDPIFSIPDPGSKRFRIPDPDPQSFLNSWKNYLGRSSRILLQNFFCLPDPGVKKAPDPGSGSATLFLILVVFFCLKIGHIWISVHVSPGFGSSFSSPSIWIRFQPWSGWKFAAVVDPHCVDPDPAFYLNADLDPHGSASN